ncbi:MAG: hypothetical protein PF443_03720 [Allgaiera sp.]|jgi:hypothetical protein|nr:hypothetical protein [Allgaiera sp.]
MTPKDFVTGLAAAMGVAHTELATADRSMAKSGLRQLARGRARPDITLEEGVQLACAWAGAESLTMAADEVNRLKGFVLATEPTPSIEDDCKAIFGAERHEPSGMHFLDAASAITRQLGAERYPAKNIWIGVEKRGPVEIGFWSSRGWVKLRFVELSDGFAFSQRPNVSVTVSIRGPVLKWIFDVTEGA